MTVVFGQAAAGQILSTNSLTVLNAQGRTIGEFLDSCWLDNCKILPLDKYS